MDFWVVAKDHDLQLQKEVCHAPNRRAQHLLHRQSRLASQGANILSTNRPALATSGIEDGEGIVPAPSAETLEVPGGSGAHEEIVLSGFSRRSQGKVRLSRPEVANFAANADTAPNPYVQSKSGLKDASRLGFSWIRPSKDEAAVFREMSKARAQAHPRRNRRGGE
jgi:hypothetical protein